MKTRDKCAQDVLCGENSMGKMKRSAPVAVPTDENDGGWLSTRNKKKISPPPLKTRGGNHLLRRPVPRLPLVMLMDDTPAALKTARKQTSIADFFCPRLQGLPPRGAEEQAVIHQVKSIKEEQASQWDDGDEMYTDFDMPGPTPAPTAQYASQKSLHLDLDMPAPPPSQVTAEASDVKDPSPSAILPPEASSPTKTAQQTSWDEPGRGSSHNRTPFCGQVGKSMENGEEKVALCEVTSKSACGKDRFLGHLGQSLRNCDGSKSPCEVCPLQEQSTQCPGFTEHRAEDTGLVGEVKEENHSHKHSNEPNYKISTARDDNTFPDSLHTPRFLNEISHTLSFSQLPEVAGTLSTSKTGYVKNRSLPRHGDPQLKTTMGSQGTRKKGHVFRDFTELNSLQFTDEGSQQDTQQQQCPSGQRSSYRTVGRKMPEQSLTASNSYEEPADSLQTPDFLSPERSLGDWQQTERWGRKPLCSGKFCAGDVSPGCDDEDLQTPCFLRGLGEGSSSGDLY